MKCPKSPNSNLALPFKLLPSQNRVSQLWGLWLHVCIGYRSVEFQQWPRWWKVRSKLNTQNSDRPRWWWEVRLNLNTQNSDCCHRLLHDGQEVKCHPRWPGSQHQSWWWWWQHWGDFLVVYMTSRFMKCLKWCIFYCFTRFGRVVRCVEHCGGDGLLVSHTTSAKGCDADHGYRKYLIFISCMMSDKWVCGGVQNLATKQWMCVGFSAFTWH